MDRREMPIMTGEPDCPARIGEIRVPERSARHEARGEREVRP